MTDHLKFYIDGQWVDPIGTATLDVINPATEESIGRIAMGNAEDVNRAVGAARASEATRARRLD
ncbi:MAG: aldehyde dehydrogenase family protein, partial [Pseudomonadales bacterium]